MKGTKPHLGFIGQGFVGKSYADDFERRGFEVTRYALEEPYLENKHLIKDTDIVFVAVPTPSTPKGFDLSIVKEALKLVGKNKIAVIKSTMLPGTTRTLQKQFPNLTILFSPEFLNAATAAHDAQHPFSNIIGMPAAGAKHKKAAELVQSILPRAQFAQICSSEEAEVYKYAHNVSGVMQVLTYNMMFDVAQELGADWKPIHKALEADPMVSNWYIQPVHKSGRGAGGMCFIKDLAAFREIYEEIVSHPQGMAFLRAAEKKNIALLTASKKDLHLLAGVYGKKMVAPSPKKRR